MLLRYALRILIEAALRTLQNVVAVDPRNHIFLLFILRNKTILNALTIDVEDYYQVSGFEDVVSREDWNDFPSRVVESTRRILQTLAAGGNVKATFFILGWVAEKFPELVREIDEAGHEIGSHSYWHRLIYRLKPDEFRDDLRRSLQVLEDIVGHPITTFRAPSFSITKNSLWALDILAEEGIQFDSSIFPTTHDRYGIPDAKHEIHEIDTRSGQLGEFPMSVGRFMGMKLPASGGGYFRLYPYWLTRRLFKQINRCGRPIMFYLHPWEVDPEQPIVPGVSALSRARHRVNLASTQQKLARLIQDFQFDTMSQTVNSASF